MKTVPSSKRNSNIELLRIICMLMIISLHYMYQGDVLNTLSYGDKNYSLAWIIESVCYVSVNCYVLISGYYLCDVTEIKKSKILDVIIETVFYSVGIYAVFCLLGVESFNVMSLITGYLFPVIHGEYWFVTVYIVLLLLVPYLNLLIRTLEKEQYKTGIILLGG